MIEAIPTAIAAFVGFAPDGPVNEPTHVRTFAEFARTFVGLWEHGTMSYAVEDFFLNGGSDAVVVRAANDAVGEGTAAQLVPPTPDETGIYALDRADVFNLLCVPPLTRTGDLPPHALAAASTYCAKRRALLIVDPPTSWQRLSDIVSAESPLTRYAGLVRRNAAIYFPRIARTDPLAGTVETFPPCGAVAGIIARTDAGRGVWKAPAGEEAVLRGIEGLAVAPTHAETEAINRLGVNCLRSFPGVGSVVWGARTMEGGEGLASEWKYISVRRTALFLEESLDRGTQWAAFEPNDEPLWAKIRLEIGAFMHELYRKGAFPGPTPDRAYFVKCDAETTTQNDIERGIVNILVGFALSRPAEFVIIRIEQVAGRKRNGEAVVPAD